MKIKEPGCEDVKRKVDLVVLSDIHLGTYGCHARELLHYMRSIEPGRVVLNGDIVDIWQFNKRYWPNSHMLVIKQLVSWMSKGIEVYYIPGNHDEMLRKFTGFNMGGIRIENKLLLNIDNKKVWIFHGDVFDVTMQHARWLTKLGAIGYDLLIYINTFCNFLLTKMGKGKISLSQKIKNSVKSAVKFINNFEQVCADVAISNKYDYVVCGHIHHPEIKTISGNGGSVCYMNSGDWVESLSSLEYSNGKWSLYKYRDDDLIKRQQPLISENVPASREIFDELLKDFNIPASILEFRL